MDGADDTQCTHSLLPPSLHNIKPSAPSSNLQTYDITTAIQKLQWKYQTPVPTLHHTFFDVIHFNNYTRTKFLLITNLMHFFFMYSFTSSLYVFQASQCSWSGDWIVLIHHLVRLVCDWLVCRSLRTGIPSSHVHRLILPDDVLIQFDLLMMSTVMLEICREMK